MPDLQLHGAVVKSMHLGSEDAGPAPCYLSSMLTS